jgi:hypothetical protein
MHKKIGEYGHDRKNSHPEIHLFQQKCMLLNGNCNGHNTVVEKIKRNIACYQVNNERYRIWILIPVAFAENKVKNYDKCKRIENSPHKSEKILNVALFEFPKTQCHQKVPVQEDLVKKIQGFPKKLYQYPHSTNKVTQGRDVTGKVKSKIKSTITDNNPACFHCIKNTK